MGTRTCTVVFTDLANYQAPAGPRDREALRNLVSVHEQMVAPVIEQFGGEVIKTIGESFLALFPAATDAVRAGVALVERISGEEGFHVRVGMATGDVEVIAGDAFGEVVNLASRILSKTPVGQVWLSEATLLCMNQAEIAWESVGRYSLKGIAGETAIHRAVPHNRAWLPEPILKAIRSGTLVRFKRDSPPGKLPPNPIILLEGFAPGSSRLEDTVASLPVIDPASLWLVTYAIP
ncbi:MAG: adenylate/guanylate cyclase domain-containing protein, partial [Myxococcota bacterium]